MSEKLKSVLFGILRTVFIAIIVFLLLEGLKPKPPPQNSCRPDGGSAGRREAIMDK